MQITITMIKNRTSLRVTEFKPLRCGWNDEIRMTKPEGMTKPETGGSRYGGPFRHLVIRHSFGFRHSCFVIYWVVVSLPMLKFVPDKNGVVTHGTTTSIGGGSCVVPGAGAIWISTRIASGSVVEVPLLLVPEVALDVLDVLEVAVEAAPVLLVPPFAALEPLICQLGCHCAPS